MFSKTCEYAIRATIVIASETESGQRISLREIARKIDSPEQFTAKILQKLAKNAIVASTKGNGGGFFIAKENFKKIKLKHIVIAIDGDAIYHQCSFGVNRLFGSKTMSVSQPVQTHSRTVKSSFGNNRFESINCRFKNRSNLFENLKKN